MLPRVLYLIDRLGRGGAAQVVVDSALSIDREQFSAVVCTTRAASPNGHDKLLRQAGIPLFELKRTSVRDISVWSEFRRLLRNVSILHSHESGSNFWARMFGPLCGVPIIVTQDHTQSVEKRPLVRLCDSLLARFSTKILVVSEHDRGMTIDRERMSPARIDVLHNSIDASRFDPTLDRLVARSKAKLPERKYIVAIVARLVHQKNHETLFKSLRLLPHYILESLSCVVVGDGPLKSELEGRVHSMRLSQHVSFLGPRTDVDVILRAADLLVLPSHWECMPVVLLEALAAKCPIVATRVGGVPEMLDGVSWPTVEPRDPVSLGRAIQSVLLMSDHDRSRIAVVGRDRVTREFSPARFADRLNGLYAQLMRDAGSGSR